jgi:glucose-1-phosphate cytidylyltransferase
VKVAILAGGAGSRLGERADVGPKPMIEIGGRPVLWHIMRHYSHHGFNEFVVAVGYRGEIIKRYLADYQTESHDVRIDVATGSISVYEQNPAENWAVDVIDTGQWTETGGRVRRLARYLGGETFMLTFGDAVTDLDLGALVHLHRSEGRLATVTAVHPAPRFGELRLEGDLVVEFSEKPMESGWTLGGYMVMEPAVLEYIKGDDEPLSPEPMQRLVKDGELAVYRHTGFWQGIDAMRDKVLLEQLWHGGSPPWRVWD